MSLARLKQLYKAELEILDSFMELLAIEQEAIAKKSTQQIEEGAEKKNQLIEELLGIEKQRRECQSALEKYQEDSIAQVISHYETALKDRLSEFQQKNRVNGAIIQNAQLFNQQILQIIAGRSQDTASYDSSGKSSNSQTETTVIARI